MNQEKWETCQNSIEMIDAVFETATPSDAITVLVKVVEPVVKRFWREGSTPLLTLNAALKIADELRSGTARSIDKAVDAAIDSIRDLTSTFGAASAAYHAARAACCLASNTLPGNFQREKAAFSARTAIYAVTLDASSDQRSCDIMRNALPIIDKE